MSFKLEFNLYCKWNIIENYDLFTLNNYDLIKETNEAYCIM